jgi:hypothetical protein
MTEKPEAMRLAEDLEIDYCGDVVAHKAAAELRRLSIENDALGLHLSERMKDLARIEAQRDALLEALRVFVSCALPVSTEIDERGHRWTEAYLDQALPIARAAIAKAEGENT